MRALAAVGLWLMMVLSAGCSDTTGGAATGVDMNRYRVFHIVQLKDGEVSAELQYALRERGFSVSAGTVASAPPDTDVKVMFDDEWRWDMRMFLMRVKMQMYDARTGTQLAASKASQVSMGAKPPKVLVGRMMDKIFGARPKGGG